jgi:undecaprenyl diphosphate synthase
MTNAPRHIGLSADGNGRWAERRGLPRTAGYAYGVAPILRVVEAVAAIPGVETLSIHVFSPGNWTRPADELAAIFDAIRCAAPLLAQQLEQTGGRFRWLGRRERVDRTVRRVLEDAEKAAAGDGLTVNLLADWGGQSDLEQAAQAVKNGHAEGIADYYRRQELPPVDLYIRPGAERRVSNFALYQLAYAEIIFEQVLWPDFTPDHLHAAIRDYQRRHRRFGHIAEHHNETGT